MGATPAPPAPDLRTMFDATYFSTILPADADATGPNASVEVHLRSGRALRLRSVAEAAAGWVTLEVFLARDEGSRPPRWQEEAPAGRGQPTYRASVAYEAIAAVTVSDAQATAGARVGFAT